MSHLLYASIRTVSKRKSAVTRELHEELARFIGERLNLSTPDHGRVPLPGRMRDQSLTHDADEIRRWWVG